MTNAPELAVGILTIASLLAAIILFLFPLSPTHKLAIYVFDLVVVIVLAADFYKRLKASKYRSRFLLNRWPEILALVPLALLSSINGQIPTVDLSVLVFVTFFRLYRLYGALKYFRRNEIVYLTAFLVITVIFGSISIFFVEPGHSGASITNFGDSVWFTVSTMTTVAYGDVVPVTVPGKIIAVMLMFAGIGILWTYVAAVASKLVAERIGKKETRSKSVDQSHEPGLENTKKVDLSKKIRQKEYDVLADIITTFKNLELRDYDELIDIIKSLKDRQSTIQKE